MFQPGSTEVSHFAPINNTIATWAKKIPYSFASDNSIDQRRASRTEMPPAQVAVSTAEPRRNSTASKLKGRVNVSVEMSSNPALRKADKRNLPENGFGERRKCSY